MELELREMTKSQGAGGRMSAAHRQVMVTAN
jgi:hypothetical protein